MSGARYGTKWATGRRKGPAPPSLQGVQDGVRGRDANDPSLQDVGVQGLVSNKTNMSLWDRSVRTITLTFIKEVLVLFIFHFVTNSVSHQLTERDCSLTGGPESARPLSNGWCETVATARVPTRLLLFQQDRFSGRTLPGTKDEEDPSKGPPRPTKGKDPHLRHDPRVRPRPPRPSSAAPTLNLTYWLRGRLKTTDGTTLFDRVTDVRPRVVTDHDHREG